MVQLTSESGGQSTTDHYPKTTVAYKTTASGLDITADIFGVNDNDNDTAPRPTVLWIHGGGLIFGTRQWIPKEQLDRYLRQGYLVVSIDHRLAPETKVPDIVQDVCDAWNWMTSTETSKKYGVDPHRVAVVGHSAGGYLALMLGALSSCGDDDHVITDDDDTARKSPVVSRRHTPQAIVSVYGYADVTGPWVAEPNQRFQPDLPPVSRDQARASVGTQEVATDQADFDPEGRPRFFFYTKQKGTWIEDCCGVPLNDGNREWLAVFEPIRYMTHPLKGCGDNYPPTLLVHGDKDNDVPVQQSLDVRDALQKAGVTVELMRNPDWPHLFDHFPDDPTVQDFLDRMLVFLQKRLG